MPSKSGVGYLGDLGNQYETDSQVGIIEHPMYVPDVHETSNLLHRGPLLDAALERAHLLTPVKPALKKGVQRARGRLGTLTGGVDALAWDVGGQPAVFGEVGMWNGAARAGAMWSEAGRPRGDRPGGRRMRTQWTEGDGGARVKDGDDGARMQSRRQRRGRELTGGRSRRQLLLRLLSGLSLLPRLSLRKQRALPWPRRRCRLPLSSCRAQRRRHARRRYSERLADPQAQCAAPRVYAAPRAAIPSGLREGDETRSERRGGEHTALLFLVLVDIPLVVLVGSDLGAYGGAAVMRSRRLATTPPALAM
ncbi:hypothetical protein B0H11DRAFT_1905408 [Mycena galericulata]|nr:hypothetical protein B0H11DRAFT_1905408 [Mycena galericulata]